tara:strand:+ start:353 stop:1726 length:1374 start_codon:yes stop_codon:yes gene_type:complete
VDTNWPLHFARLPQSADIAGIRLSNNNVEWVSKIPKVVTEAIKEIAVLDGGCWLVGGAVRELLIGNPVKDWDLATTLPPLELSNHFKSLGLRQLKVIDTGIKFGTFTLIWSGVIIEITTLRKDINYVDGRRPSIVSFGNSLKEDLERRDFTINSMAMDLSRGILYDPHNGLDDLRKKELRAVGNPRRRMAEDGLRLLRAYRFLDQGNLGLFTLHRDLHEALLKEQWMLDKISKERIWSELQKIFQGINAGQIIWLMTKHKMLDYIFNLNFTVDDLGIKSQSEDFLHDNKTTSELRFSLLFYGCTLEELISACDLLVLSNKQKKNIVKHHTFFGNLPPNDRGIMRLWRFNLGSQFENQLLLELAISKYLGTRNEVKTLITEFNQLPELRAGRLPLANGTWIMEKTGLEKGKKLGRLKEWLHRLQIERDLIELDDIYKLLITISWEYSDYKNWPRVNWI